MRSIRQADSPCGGKLSGGQILRSIMECAGRDWDCQERLIRSVMKFQAQEYKTGECPSTMKDFPGKGRGLVANRDIKEGEIVGFYPVDWFLNGRDHKGLITGKPEGPIPIQDQHTWSMYQGLCGDGNREHEPENYTKTADEIIENNGIITKMLETYGYTFHGDEMEETDLWRGYQDMCSESWADPRLKHKNDWMNIHFGNDGIFCLNQTKEEYIIKCHDNAQAVQDWRFDDIISNVMLDYVAVALRDIKEGEEISDSYGPDYWWNGRLSKSDEANIDKSNRGKVKKYKAKKKKAEKDRRHAWHTLIQTVVGTYNELPEEHEDYPGPRELWEPEIEGGGITGMTLMIATRTDGSVCLAQNPKVQQHVRDYATRQLQTQ